jgi:hypothetical protein
VYVEWILNLYWCLEDLGRIARMEEGRSAFTILTDISTGKKPLGKPRHR